MFNYLFIQRWTVNTCDTKFEYCLLQTENTSQQSSEESVEVSTHIVCTLHITMYRITEVLNHILRAVYFSCNFHDNFLNYYNIKFESKSVKGQNLKINYVAE